MTKSELITAVAVKSDRPATEVRDPVWLWPIRGS